MKNKIRLRFCFSQYFFWNFFWRFLTYETKTVTFLLDYLRKKDTKQNFNSELQNLKIPRIYFQNREKTL